jgi:hypothetical protein
MEGLLKPLQTIDDDSKDIEMLTNYVPWSLLWRVIAGKVTLPVVHLNQSFDCFIDAGCSIPPEYIIRNIEDFDSPTSCPSEL